MMHFIKNNMNFDCNEMNVFSKNGTRVSRWKITNRGRFFLRPRDLI